MWTPEDQRPGYSLGRRGYQVVCMLCWHDNQHVICPVRVTLSVSVTQRTFVVDLKPSLSLPRCCMHTILFSNSQLWKLKTWSYCVPKIYNLLHVWFGHLYLFLSPALFSTSLSILWLDLEMAVAYWNLVLTGRFKFLDLWNRFLLVSCCGWTQVKKKTRILTYQQHVHIWKTTILEKPQWVTNHVSNCQACIGTLFLF